MPDDASFDELMVRLKTGDQQAARDVFTRFVERLIALSRTQMNAKLRRKVDPEDVVQSVFKSFFARHADDQYELADWTGLWALLATITVHKCGHKIDEFSADRRNINSESSTPFLSEESRPDWEALARDPSPSHMAILHETFEQLKTGLGDRDRQILDLGLQGLTTEEIGEEIRCSERTARRVLKRVQRKLEEMRDG
jgi:RNA polymerase sigma-70 factor (ECF subfamily)